jgi:hypothetical protein
MNMGELFERRENEKVGSMCGVGGVGFHSGLL